MRAAVAAARAGDVKAAVKFCGVYSHTIADTAEPIHAVNPDIIDLVLPPPASHISLELHSGVEGRACRWTSAVTNRGCWAATLSRPSWAPLPGWSTPSRSGLRRPFPSSRRCTPTTAPRPRGCPRWRRASRRRQTADFMYTVFWLGGNGAHGDKRSAAADHATLDLCQYPYVGCLVDMLYRYRPMVDLSLIPYSGGKSHPLSLRTASGGVRAGSRPGRRAVPGPAVHAGPPSRNDGGLLPRARRVQHVPRAGWGQPAVQDRHRHDGLPRAGRRQGSLPLARPVARGCRRQRRRRHRRRPMADPVHALFLQPDLSEDVQRLPAITWPNHGVWAEPRLE